MSNPTIEDRLEWTLADNVRQAMEISRLSSEVSTANARERKAFMAGCQYACATAPNDWDQEQGWQQYRCQDDSDWEVSDMTDEAKIDAALVSEELPQDTGKISKPRLPYAPD